MIKNLIGALTSKPYAFTARSWELKNTDSIDLFDAVGSNLKVSTRGSSILRVLPKINDKVNEEWITDKARFSYDALKFQRIVYCFKKNKQIKFLKINWFKVFSLLINKNYIFENLFLKKNKKAQSSLNLFVGNFTDLETLDSLNNLNKFFLKEINIINSSIFFKNNDLRSNYVFQSNFEKHKICLIFNSNVRFEAPALNLKIRKNVLSRNLIVYKFGYNSNLTYITKNLGNSNNALITLLEGKAKVLSKVCINNNYSLLIFGSNYNFGGNLLSIKNYFSKKIKNSNCNILFNESSSINFLENGTHLKKINRPQGRFINWFLNDDKTILNPLKKDIYNIYQGHHNDFNFSNSNLILPSTVFTEKNSTFINFMGFVQKTKFIDSSLLNKDVRDDVKIISNISNSFSKNKDYVFIKDIINYDINNIKNHSFNFKLLNLNYNFFIRDFYRNDSISKNSPTMALTSNRMNFKKSSFKK